MNIFVTDPDPAVAATHLDDKRLNKMIIETFQMIATVLHQVNAPVELIPVTKHERRPYKVTHPYHPCVKWLRESQGNYRWTLRYLAAMIREYRFRFKESHPVGFNMRNAVKATEYIPQDYQTPFVNCSLLHNMKDIHKAYKATLYIKWTQIDKKKPKWTKRGPPDWYIESQKGNQ